MAGSSGGFFGGQVAPPDVSFPQSVKSLSFPISTTTTSSLSQLPANTIVLDTIVEISSVYNAGATIEVGIDTDTDLLQESTDNDAESEGLYKKEQKTGIGGLSKNVRATISASSGSGSVFVLYSDTPLN